MPNGSDKNLVRLYILLNGFRAKFDSWPTVVRLPSLALKDLRERVLKPEGAAKLESHLRVIEDESRFAAEDSHGNQLDYGDSQEDGFGAAERWLDIQVHVRVDNV